MKTALILSITGIAALTIIGCDKSTDAPVKPETASATETAKSLTEKATDTAKDVAVKATEAVKTVAASATNTVNAVSEPFNDGVASAKKLLAEKNYQGALTELNKLSSLKLSDEQTKVVDGLKADAQAMISKATGGATDAVKGLLGK